MSFLTGIVSSLIEWGIGKLYSWLSGLAAIANRQKQVQDQAQQDVQPLKDAKTPQEIEDATKSSLDHM